MWSLYNQAFFLITLIVVNFFLQMSFNNLSLSRDLFTRQAEISIVLSLAAKLPCVEYMNKSSLLCCCCFLFFLIVVYFVFWLRIGLWGTLDKQKCLFWLS